MNERAEMYAFWEHEKFPYLIGARVVGGPSDTGCVQVENYAQRGPDGVYRSGWVFPVWFTTIEAGQALSESLKSLEASRASDLRELEARRLSQLVDRLPPRLVARHEGLQAKLKGGSNGAR